MATVPAWAIDDPLITAPMRLLRRVHKCTVKNGLIDSSTFEAEPGEGLSVTLWSAPSDLDDIRRFHEDFGVICFDVAVVRAVQGAIIARASLVGNLNHCEIWPKLGKGGRRTCKNNHRWVHYPDWVLPAHRGATENF